MSEWNGGVKIKLVNNKYIDDQLFTYIKAPTNGYTKSSLKNDADLKLNNGEHKYVINNASNISNSFTSGMLAAVGNFADPTVNVET